jgi:Ca2+-transporting ATPase
MAENFYSKTVSQVLKDFETSEQGLSEGDVLARQGKYGLNVLPEAKVDGIMMIFVRQFQSPLIYILLGAGALIYLMGEPVDAGVILAVLVFNALIGAFQEGRAQNTLQALKKLSETKATVLRGGVETIVPGSDVVPGDILILAEGEKIPLTLVSLLLRI